MKVTVPAPKTNLAQSYPGSVNSLIEINSILFFLSGKKIGAAPAVGSLQSYTGGHDNY